jgi:predicted RNA-binding Zn ribbon-like protein
VHWVEVDGYPLPKKYGGHPALDFCNTWSGWDEPPLPRAAPDPRREWLRDYDRFVVWSGYVGLVGERTVERLRNTARRAAGPAGRLLVEARTLRGALYAHLTHTGDDTTFDEIARFAQRAVRSTELVLDADGAATRVIAASAGLVTPLLAVARSIEELLASPERNTVRTCPGQDCGWLFVDPRRRRRWCSMESCGNRAKVKSFAARHST